MEVKRIGDFIAALPEDTRVVVVIQRGMSRTVLRTDEVSCGTHPCWTEAVWDGMTDAMREDGVT